MKQVEWKWLLGVLLSILFIGFSWYFKDDLSKLQAFGLFGIFLINFFSSLTVFIPIPGIASVVAGGALYSPFFVALSATSGAVLGDVAGYVLGLSSASLIVKRRELRKYDFLEQLFKKWGGVTIFLFAFIPNPVFDAVGLLAGALSYPLTKFTIYLFLGRLLRNILISFLGFQLL